MAEGHGSGDQDKAAHHEWWKNRSYVGLICVLVVIAAFIAILLYMGVGPLSQQQGAAAPSSGARGTASANNGSAPPAPAALTYAALPAPDTVLTKIAFGSGLDQNRPLDILSAIAAQQPQLFIFAGDAVSADPAAGAPPQRVASPLLIPMAYATLGAAPAFQTFRAHIPILAVWGGDDYGLKGAGGDFPYKEASKEVFFNFYRLSEESARHRPDDGIYEAYSFGPIGERVQIILLDTRWNRAPLAANSTPGAGGYGADRDPAKTMLGDAQWKWLAQQLIEPADLRLVVSPIQVLANGDGPERWADLPFERDTLFQVLNDTNAQGVIFISGDLGAAAIYKNDNAVGYSLYEITSSPLNQAAAPPPDQQDPQRQEPLYTQPNFGDIEIDWQAHAANLELRDKTGQLLQGLSMPFEQDQPGSP